MKRKFSTKFVLTLSLITMFVWLASNGCSHHSSDPPANQISPPQISVSSRQIANSDVVLNYSLDQTVSIQSTGSTTLNIGAIAQANPLTAPFSIVSDGCSRRGVQPSASCSFTVRFQPTSTGPFADSFDIPSDASNENSVTVNVTGSGILGPPPPPVTSSALISVSSSSIDFGNVVLNNILEQTVSTQNTGSANLYIGQIAQINPLGPPFSIASDNCSLHAVQPSASCSFKVQFSPTSQVTSTNSFDIPSNAFDHPSVTVNVTGTGQALRVAINQVTSICSTTGGLFDLIVSVTDQNNSSLATQPTFTLKENGVPQTISVSQTLTPVPISVATLLDYTTSVQTQIPTIEAASRYFIGLLTANDEASIIKFAQYPQLMQDFTNDTGLLNTAINTAPTAIGMTNVTSLYDALWYAIGNVAVRQKHKAIVLVSDGKDEYQGGPIASVKTLDEVIASAKANSVTIYPVGLGNADGPVMTRLASETGGIYYYMTDVNQLQGIYQAISDIFQGQYSVTYTSLLHGSTPIILEIDVANGTDTGVATTQVTGCP